MAERREIVQRNPLLRLVKVPSRERPDVRGKDPSRIKDLGRYKHNRAKLLEAFSQLPRDPDRKRADHAGHFLVWAKMHADSLANTHTPHDLFSENVGAIMKMPWRDGYVVEVSDQALTHLAKRVSDPSKGAHRCDIYSVKQLQLFSTVLAEDGRIDEAWEAAPVDENGLRRFTVRLADYVPDTADASVFAALAGLSAESRLRIAQPITAESGALTRWMAPDLSVDLLEGRKSVAVALSDRESLQELVLTGSITRWEPVTPLRPTIPGDGAEPSLQLPSLDDEPVVGVIDGGYHTNRYANAVAWRQLPVLVPDQEAARSHGNKVSSVVVDAHLWSNQLQLPQLHCQLGVVQALPSEDSRFTLSAQSTLAHIEQAFIDHPDTHVWNLSANTEKECDEYEVSELGRGLAEIARRHKKLLVISAGNRNGDSLRIAPPADCEAALVVAGRTHDEAGAVSGACAVSRVGLGPEGMLKPETSWFSSLRVLGGEIASGTSFAAPLVSRLAAHTWRNLADPSPDMVKALLLTASDLNSYSREMGFGSPVSPEFPWNCPPNAAVVAWTESMTYMQRYYWTGIRVPPSLMQNGRFRGRAKLVSILAPHVAEDGHHYFQTRIEAGLSYRAERKGKMENVPLAGCLNPLEIESAAREDDNKWDPVRVYEKDCRRTRGVAIPGDQPSLQVYSRLFWRDTYRYDTSHMQTTPCDVTFVVTLESGDPDADTYNEFRRIMAEEVVSAVIEQEVEVDDLAI
ncbi:S8 family peptidase [uncultured Brevundimonas sp.]|uniref:S8 family peptidase n=1 Tax=uncultured Brevundimonas sp. TaxID=213418 RepID=UPI0025F94E9A|nr:S8 family peptidase [uncultured Brevundimonas sp.]